MTARIGTIIIAIGATVLALLHQDFWWWNDRSLVMGFMPIGLAYHALFSIAAACWWALALKIAWPADLIATADDEPASSEGAKP